MNHKSRKNFIVPVILIGLAMVSSLFFSTAAHAINWTPTYEQGFAKSKELNKPLMLVFYTDACGYCKKLERETLSDPRVEKILKGFVCVHINCKDRPELQRKYRIRGVPLVLFISADGKKDWLVGFRTADKFIKELNQFIGYMNR